MSADTIVERTTGVVKLDVPTYEAIEHDNTAVNQAAVVVVIVAIASGIGAIAENGVLGLVGGLILAVIGWVLFSVVAYLVGTKLIPGDNTDATIPQLLGPLGYAQAPGILSIFAILGAFGAFVGLIGSIWALVCAIIALRQALDMSTGRAIGVGLISAIITGIIVFIVALPFGIAAVAMS